MSRRGERSHASAAGRSTDRSPRRRDPSPWSSPLQKTASRLVFEGNQTTGDSMRTMVRYALPCAGLLVMGGSGCAGRQSAASPTARHVESAQQRSQQALDRAAEAQKRASRQGEVVAQAQREVQDAQRRLTEAQERLGNEQVKAEQLQQQAIEARTEATREAQASQQEASRALSLQGEHVKRREQTFSGQVSQATADSIVVTPQVGEPMRFTRRPQARSSRAEMHASRTKSRERSRRRPSSRSSPVSRFGVRSHRAQPNPGGRCRPRRMPRVRRAAR